MQVLQNSQEIDNLSEWNLAKYVEVGGGGEGVGECNFRVTV
jgi:hypothetical protein